MRRAIWPRDQLGELVPDNELWQLASQPSLRSRVPRPPFVPSHSSAALEAKAHALVERAAAFAPPAVAIPDYRPYAGLLPNVPGVQPF